ncbi:zinc finger MYM-type protein 1-like [Hydractinia symbiolongicarpus]|uniref:zinc finger MYM-type protein 1-like n=1 Tax=Hydractinia symbiolongicarpus TaxID=13093 RepID=UPI00255026EE|nr:zinc finger MYM-type protein 1-like [Hydractinia symbiolongicarpus]
MLLKLLQSVRYLGRQSLPFRGNLDEETHSELNSNFHQLLLLRCEDDKELSAWLAKNQNYTSPAIQNEMLRIEALSILRDIAKNIQSAEIFTILADETGDVSNTEQLVICIRWVDDELQAHEEFIGLHPLPDTSADQIVFLIKDILLRMNLKLENARGQCYDGAASMAGHRSGVATQIKSLNEKCLYTHCYGHALNLAVGDVIKEIPELKEAFGTAYEICKLVKKSPKRDTQLKNIREATGIESNRSMSFLLHDGLCEVRFLNPFLKTIRN